MPKKKSPSARTANLSAREPESAGATRRVSRLTPKLSAEIIRAFAVKGSLNYAASAAGIELKTLHEWLERGRREKKGIYRALSDGLSFPESQAKPEVAGPMEPEPPVGALLVDVLADGSTLPIRIAPPSKPLKTFLDELEARGGPDGLPGLLGPSAKSRVIARTSRWCRAKKSLHEHKEDSATYPIMTEHS